MVYEQLREGAMMCNMTYMILPEGSIQDLDLSMLQMIGVFDEVQTGLWEAVLVCTSYLLQNLFFTTLYTTLLTIYFTM